MITRENNCVDCGRPCWGESCPYVGEIHIYCDTCGEDVEKVYDVDGEHMCEDCLKSAFDEINEDNAERYL